LFYTEIIQRSHEYIPNYQRTNSFTRALERYTYMSRTLDLVTRMLLAPADVCNGYCV